MRSILFDLPWRRINSSIRLHNLFDKLSDRLLRKLRRNSMLKMLISLCRLWRILNKLHALWNHQQYQILPEWFRLRKFGDRRGVCDWLYKRFLPRLKQLYLSPLQYLMHPLWIQPVKLYSLQSHNCTNSLLFTAQREPVFDLLSCKIFQEIWPYLHSMRQWAWRLGFKFNLWLFWGMHNILWFKV